MCYVVDECLALKQIHLSCILFILQKKKKLLSDNDSEQDSITGYYLFWRSLSLTLLCSINSLRNEMAREK